jgi:hypothetical protein
VRQADNHRGWNVEVLLPGGWFPQDGPFASRDEAIDKLEEYIESSSEQEFRVYEAI